MLGELYYISTLSGLSVINPEIPDLRGEMAGMENTKIKRISLCPTLSGAVIAKHLSIHDIPEQGLILTVYSPLRYRFNRINNDDLIKKWLVTDAPVSEVLWATDSIQVVAVKTIKVYPSTAVEFLYKPAIHEHEKPLTDYVDGRHFSGKLYTWVIMDGATEIVPKYELERNRFIQILGDPLPSMEAIKSVNLESIKSVYDKYTKHLIIDKAFARKLLLYVNRFETKNEEHINFIGSNLLGIYKIKFTYDDENEWIDNIIGVEDWEGLTDDYLDLDEVDRYGAVGQSPVNMSFIYLVHRVLTSSILGTKDTVAVAEAIIRMLHYKFIASLLSHYFPYKAQESIALALYESLSKKSLLKKHFSWGGLVKARAEEVVGDSGIHKKTLRDFNNDGKILYVVTDIQSRIRDVIKKLTRDYNILRENDSRILAESKFIQVDGESVMREYENNVEALIRNMQAVFADKYDFIRDELVEQTLKLVNTADKRFLLMALDYIPKSYGIKRAPDIDKLVMSLIVYIQEHRRRATGDDANMVSVIVKLRNMYRSSQLTNPDIVYVRDTVTEIVTAAIPSNKHSGIISATRIACLVYITLRILTYKHFR